MSANREPSNAHCEEGEISWTMCEAAGAAGAAVAGRVTVVGAQAWTALSV